MRTIASTPTFHDLLNSSDRSASGFHLIRLLLAVVVVFVHSFLVTRGTEGDIQIWLHPLRGLAMFVLPMFFAMSGFLVAGSFERTDSLARFLALRAVRIFPALILVVVLCALVLGPMVTTVPLAEYFRDPAFFQYFLNVFGSMQQELPGVFGDLPVAQTVNLSAWTVDWDLLCYLIFSILVILGLYRRKFLVLGLLIPLCVTAPFFLDITPYYPRPFGHILIVAYLCGVAMYQFKDRIVHSGWLAVISGFIAFICFTWSFSAYWGIPFAAYVTIYLGLLKAPNIPLIMRNDYSYGLYLFAFPVQQLQVYLFPDDRIWYLNSAFGLTVGMLCAFFSWHCVEQPINNRRIVIVGAIDAVAVRTHLRTLRRKLTEGMDRAYQARA